jgi:hypothetical protein
MKYSLIKKKRAGMREWPTRLGRDASDQTEAAQITEHHQRTRAMRSCSGGEAETVGMMKLSGKRTEERLGKRSTGSPGVRVHARRGR